MITQIKAHRALNKLTQRELAKLVGTTQQALQRIEAGVSRPSLEMASRICCALHVSPCVIFPALAISCTSSSILHASGPSDQALSGPKDTNWQVQVAGADELYRNYWVCEDEARRIQQSLARFNSPGAVLGSTFLGFMTPERAVAVNLNVIDRLSIEFWAPEDPFRRVPPPATTDVLLLLRNGAHFGSFVLYVSREENEDFSSNFNYLTRVGSLPFFSVTKEKSGVHLVSTKQIAIVEIARRLVQKDATATWSQNQIRTMNTTNDQLDREITSL